MDERPAPPKLLTKVLGIAFHPGDRNYALADLEVEFLERLERDGRRSARWWYRRQVVTSIVPALRGRLVRRGGSGEAFTATAGTDLLSGFLMDLRLSMRTMMKAPLVLVVTVASLGAGIGAVTVTFAIVDEVILAAPVGLEAPDRLVTVYRSNEDGPYGRVSYSDYVDLASGLPAVGAVAALSVTSAVIDGPIPPRSVLAEGVSLNYFELTGIPALAGRTFTPQEIDGAAAPRVAVLGHDLWMSAFAGRSQAIGSSVRINGRTFIVIGVAPDGVNARRVPLETDVWIPLGSLQADGLVSEEQRLDRGQATFDLFGRLAPGATIAAAQEQAAALSKRLRTESTAWTDGRGIGREFSVVSERGSRLNPRARALFTAVGLFLMGTAGLILLLACTNVAGLFMARARRRRTEFAVRASLGASRGRILRMMLAEGLVPGFLGGALGVALTVVATSLIGSFRLPVQLPIRLDAEVTPKVLVFAFLLSVLASLAFSLLPALQGSITRLGSGLRAGMRGDESRGRFFSAKNNLVVLQCAMSLILLVGASLFLRALDLATQTNLGFDPGGIAVATKQLDPERMEPREGIAYIRALRARLASEAGVQAVAMARSLELTLFMNDPLVRVLVDGVDPMGQELPPAFRNAVTPGYLEALEVDLLQGRGLDESDTEDSRAVAVINETFGRRYWPDADAIGRSFTVGRGEDARVFEVVGMTQDGKYLDFDDGFTGPPVAAFWTSLYQDYTPHFAVAVKGRGSAESMLPVLHRNIQLSDGEIQRVAPSTLASQVSVQFMHLRIASKMLGWGGLFGLFLAAIGIYGVVSFSVAQRSKEMAIRLALGAERKQVVGSLAGGGLRLAAVGLVFGVAAVVPMAQLAKGVLFGVSATDPWAMGAGICVLLLVAAAASLVPARRLARTDTMATLRTE